MALKKEKIDFKNSLFFRQLFRYPITTISSVGQCRVFLGHYRTSSQIPIEFDLRFGSDHIMKYFFKQY